MAERRWELKIGSPVMATDVSYGHLEQLLVDPHQERVAALLVRSNGLIPSPVVVVPEELIADASETMVQLAISREQVDALPKLWSETSELVVEDQKYEADDDLFAVRGAAGVAVGRAPSSREPGVIESQVSATEHEPWGLRVRAGQQVFCQDGHAGRISLILADANGQVTGLVIQTGRLPLTGRGRIVPAAWVQEVDRENVHLSVSKSDLESQPEYHPDDALAEMVDSALRSDEILRNTDYREIGLSVQDGIVLLRGHVVSSTNKTKAENAARSVAGVLDVKNDLVVDQDLAINVAQMLGMDKLTRFERISVSAHNGVIKLNGQVGSVAIRDEAETIAAALPSVRGVINDLQAPDVTIDLEEQRFCQPPVGREVYAADMLLGNLERVIINPHNRLVTAFIVHGSFPDPRMVDDPIKAGKDLFQERRVVIPVYAVRHATDSSVLLTESSVAAALHPDFDHANFISPPQGWQPPYPYRSEEVLFDKQLSANDPR